jgi:hypothetical protein
MQQCSQFKMHCAMHLDIGIARKCMAMASCAKVAENPGRRPDNC